MSTTNLANKTSVSASRASLNAALESSQNNSKAAEVQSPVIHNASVNASVTVDNNRPGSGVSNLPIHDLSSSHASEHPANTSMGQGNTLPIHSSTSELQQSSHSTQKKTQQRRIIAEDPEWNLAPVEKLTELCLRLLVANFEKNPCIGQIPLKYRERVLSTISTDLPLSIAAPLIPDDAYWKKCATQKFTHCDPSRHGMSWKRLFFETHVQNLIESYLPNSRPQEKTSLPPASTKSAGGSLLATGSSAKPADPFTDTHHLIGELKLASPFVKRLDIGQMKPREPVEGTLVKSTDPPPDHISAEILFGHLTNLEDVNLYYGVKDCGMGFEWKLFGMTLNDCLALSSSLRMPSVASTLKYLKIQSSGIDDDRARLIASSLVDNNLSHNSIGCKGARGFAKVLSSKLTSLTHLILSNNKIGKDGIHAIGRALASTQQLVNASANPIQLQLKLAKLAKTGPDGKPQEKKICGDNTSLQVLHLRMNRVGDDGGAEFFRMLTRNDTLKSLDMAATGIGKESVAALCGLIRKNSKNLRSLDVSCNKLGSSNVNSINSVVNGTNGQEGALDLNGSATANTAAAIAAETQMKLGNILSAAGVTQIGEQSQQVEADEAGKQIFEAITHNKYITMLDLRVTHIPFEYLTAIQGIVVENSDILGNN